MRKGIVLFLLGTGLAFVALALSNRLPSLENRTTSIAVTDTGATRLGKAVAPLLASHPGLSGIRTLRDARDAFAARYMLASAADRTLDVQYYIWRRDLSGVLLMKALVDAADRGVRVRLLLDDTGTTGLDDVLAAVDAHPRIEVRLFNPFVVRKPRAAGYLTDFPRLNRRMHNKSFTADSQATIIGGRNVGDEYFATTHGVLFADLDAIAIGPVVGEVSRDFDRYWASDSAYPVDRLLRPVEAGEIAELSAAAQGVASDPAAVAYMSALRNSPFVRELIAGTLPLDWAVTRMISDDPAKVLGRGNREELLLEKMRRIFGEPAKEVDLVSPYFVPRELGVRLFSEWARRGVKVRVLTNSLEATDVAAVHAGYAKRRQALLQSGVAIYELRAAPGVAAPQAPGPFGSSGSSLHAKTFAVDRSRVFIGSFNFDPRSVDLNTEMGFVIDSPAIARRVATVFDTEVPPNAYEVRLNPSGDEYWIERGRGVLRRHHAEPGTSFWRRAGVSLLSAVPIEWLL